jgi:hypothetical protein
MEFKVWIMGQIAVDVFMFILLLVILMMHLKVRFSGEGLDKSIRRSEVCLAELKEIGVGLEKNLSEKRDLSQSLLSEMDKRLGEARRVSEELRRILMECREEGLSSGRNRVWNPSPTGESIRALLEKGLTKEEVSKHYNVPSGELDLILKLRSAEGPQETPHEKTPTKASKTG